MCKTASLTPADISTSLHCHICVQQMIVATRRSQTILVTEPIEYLLAAVHLVNWSKSFWTLAIGIAERTSSWWILHKFQRSGYSWLELRDWFCRKIFNQSAVGMFWPKVNMGWGNAQSSEIIISINKRENNLKKFEIFPSFLQLGLLCFVTFQVRSDGTVGSCYYFTLDSHLIKTTSTCWL